MVLGTEQIGLPHQDRWDVVLAAEATAVSEARALVRRALGSLDEDRADRAVLCGSELITNAVRHGQVPIVLTVIRTPDRAVVAVADGSRRPPCPRSAGPGDDTGRGTLVVDRLADRWGVEFLPAGKQVWCQITLDSSRAGVKSPEDPGTGLPAPAPG